MSKLTDRVATKAATLGWNVFQSINRRIPEGKAIHPEWAPGPLPKSRDRTMPPLGFPRETDSLCPECVKEVRRAVIAGERDISELTEGHPGEIKARLLEENGRIVIRKHCPEHGRFEDVLSIDPEFTRNVEARFYGRDFRTAGDERVHRHGTSSIRYGRGAVLTVDLTNRCNMMCNPCFMDANQVGYVHELSLDDIRRVLDTSVSFKPRRQMSVQFSGGEPTLSPHFLDACRYAKKVGYYYQQAASNGLRFATEPGFAEAAKEAGLDMVYLQFDGVTNEANSHRHIANLFDAKLQAIENISAAGLQITPVVTIVNGLNDDQVPHLVQFLLDNSATLDGLAFQPVSFTGRDEDISDADRARQRYTPSHLAHELERWSGGKIDAHRDWFPLGAAGALTVLADHLRGSDVAFGGLSCSCHPNCGCTVYLLTHTKTGEYAPVTRFFDLEGFIHDINVMTDTARDPRLIKAQAAMSIVRNFNPAAAPDGFGLRELSTLLNERLGGSLDDAQTVQRETNHWKFQMVGAMWFQDLWTYDFRRTEMCVIPYGTQEGEISFCAYNTGIGWRQIIENMHMTATTAEWFSTKGRHKIYAGNRPVPLPKHTHSVALRVVQSRASGPSAVEGGSVGCGCGSGLEERVRRIVAAPDRAV